MFHFPPPRITHLRRTLNVSSSKLRSDQTGITTVEHAGVYLVAAAIVLAILTVSFTPLADNFLCTIESAISNSPIASCRSDVKPVSVGRPSNESGSDTSKTNGAQNARHTSNTNSGAQNQSKQAGSQDSKSNAAPANSNENVDQAKVNNSLKQIREGLDGGWNGVSTGDLEKIERAFNGLNGAEVDSVIKNMSDDELKQWVKLLERSWWFGWSGWDVQRRQQMWTKILKDASPETVRRLAGITNDIQPKYDDVAGDAANDDTKQNNREYKEVDPNAKPVVNGVNPDDVSQGALGDCWYIASLQAVARSNPKIIEEAITDNGNGTYTVRLYHDGKPVYVTVTGDQVENENGPEFAKSTDRKELWPNIMEKALASYEGSYGAIEKNSPSHGLEVITGQKSTTKNDFSAKDLKNSLDNGEAVAIGSKNKPWQWPWSEDNPNSYPDPLYRPNARDANGNNLSDPLHYNHAYSVKSVDLGDPNDDSDDKVTLVNPWGQGYAPITLRFEDFKSHFREFSFNSTK